VHSGREPSLALLVCITASGTLPVHILIPALPAIAEAFGGASGAAQLTVTLYLAGLAIGQLVYGPLSDRFGRRPVLLVGLAIYAVATIAAAFAPSLQWLIVERVAQAFGGCAGLVLGRAIARDNLTGHHAIRRLAVLMIAMSLAPALAPLLGAQLVLHFGWRSILYVLAVASVLMFITGAITLPETHAQRGSKTARQYATSYLTLARSPTFVAFAVGGASGTTSFYAFVAASPFVLMQELGVSQGAFSAIYVTILAGVALGGTAGGALASRLPAQVVLRTGSALLIGSSVALAIVYAIGLMTIGALTALMLAYVAGTALTSPYALAEAVEVEPAFAGAASGLYGFAQMGYGALATALIALGHANPASAMIATLVASSILSCASFEVARRGRRTRAIEA
jgi:DHA1 family bicyclomycin/chloramphenicol resistance-like MFS transporter